MALRFAFLVLEEHPYGREMLRALLDLGFCPAVIIQEVSTIGDVEREKFLTRMAGQPLYKDMPVGATVHFIDPGIDTGDIIYREQLPVHRHDTYESLNGRVAVLAAELMARALQAFTSGDAPRTPQRPNEGETFKVIPDDLLEEGKRRLAEGRYSHFAE
jgi:hypothetical protein